MKTRKYTFPIITGVLVAIALSGLFEQQALAFVKSVAENNIKFLALVSEIKIVMAGISKINIPFLDGHSGEILNDLSDAQHRLLQSNAIVLLQFLLLTMAKSQVIKIVLIVLYILTFYNRTKQLASKLLTLFLVLVPGLAIFTVMINSLSVNTSINFGNGYIQKLEMNVKKIKEEKSMLMEQHAQQQTLQNNSESPHHDRFKELKENIAYDFKKASLSFHGDYATIRMFVNVAEHELIQQVVNFCSMILFCFIFLPFGYVIIVYTVYKTVFGGANSNIHYDEPLPKQPEPTSFFKRFRNAFTAARTELVSDVKSVEKNMEEKLKQEVMSDINKDLDNFVKEEKSVESNLKNSAESAFNKEGKVVKDDAEENAKKIGLELKNETEHIEHKLAEAIDVVEEKVSEVFLDKKADSENVLKEEETETNKKYNPIISL